MIKKTLVSVHRSGLDVIRTFRDRHIRNSAMILVEDSVRGSVLGSVGHAVLDSVRDEIKGNK